VLTRSGAKSIESMNVGDLVLTQETKTGELSYQPVLVVHHNPPNVTLEIDLGEETIVATPIHRFWLAGTGWIMARDLKAGDSVRVLGASSKIRGVRPGSVQPVFNLEVARGHSFFVGERGALVHDNSLVLPTPEPFDAPLTVAASTR